MLLRIALATIVLVGSVIAAAAASDQELALSALRKAAPGVHWNTQDQVAGDVDCDGRSDLSYIGEGPDYFVVATVLGPISPASKISMVRLAKSGNSQDALNDARPHLSMESMDYNTKDAFGGNLEGFMQSERCIGLIIPLSDTDPIHLYWNHKAHRLGWWRL